jgi:hypothetical protein
MCFRLILFLLKNIKKVDNFFHSGVKYAQFTKDQYTNECHDLN